MAADSQFIPFTKPTIDDAVVREVSDCLRSGWLASGPRVERLCRALQRYLGAPHAVLLTSATAGLHLALRALDLQPGDEVITTPLTFVATANVIVQAGGRPVFVDIDPRTRNLDPDRVAGAVSEHTRAILPVHFAGLPADLDAIHAIARRHDLRVIEDAAHAIGAEYLDRRIGSFGDTQVFSFHPNKNMTTGEGGCVTTSDVELAARVERDLFHGIDRREIAAAQRSAGAPYDVSMPGFKYNMMDLQAAIGLCQLEQLEAFLQRRQKIVERYFEKLADWPQWRLPARSAAPGRHAWHLFAPELVPEKAGIDRAGFIEAMRARKIGIGIHYPAVHLFRFYREQFGYGPGDFPVAERVASNIVSLPLFPDLTGRQQERVMAAMRDVFA